MSTFIELIAAGKIHLEGPPGLARGQDMSWLRNRQWTGAAQSFDSSLMPLQAVAWAKSGISRLTSLFSSDVRSRAASYLNNGGVDVLTSTRDMLFAEVTGSDTYATLYQRRGTTVFYGCTCPYFVEGLEGCKHLWALALEGEGGPLVQSLDATSHFEPSIEVLFDEPESRAVATTPRAGAGGLVREAKIPAPDWRELFSLASDSTKPGAHELVYFWVPGSSESDHRVLVRRRRVGTVGPLKPVSWVSAEEFAHASDRELYTLMQATPSQYYRMESVLLKLQAGTLSFFLRRLAETGRCHVVPRDEAARGDAWRRAIAGTRPSKRERSKRAPDPMLEWPLLKNADASAHVQLRLLEDSEAKSGGPARFSVHADLVIGDDVRELSSVRAAVGDTLVVDDSIVNCAPGDVQWLTAARRAPRVRVSEVEIPAFVEKAGQRGARVTLPKAFKAVESARPPTPQLRLAAPGPCAVSGDVSFDYDGHPVPAAARGGVLFLDDRRVQQRDLDAERAAVERLRGLGLSGPLLSSAGGHLRVESGDVIIQQLELAAVIRALLASGWAVFAQERQYRRPGEIKIEVESGVDWFAISGAADFGDVIVPLPRLLRELRQGRGFIELGNGEIGLLPEEWMARWGLFASLLPEKADTLRFSNRQIGLMQTLLCAVPDESGAEGLAALRSRLDVFQNISTAAPPASFGGQLRPYQAMGLGWLHAMKELEFGVCLADDMGLGKTIQILAYLAGIHEQVEKPPSSRRRRAVRETPPSLVVVPRSLVGNWVDEARRFTPHLRVRTHWGRERGTPGDWDDVDVVVTTYGTLRADIEAMATVSFTSIVLDEAQAIKNESSATAKCAKLLRGRHRIALSGTPVENHVGELWSLFDFMNPGMLDELPGFKKRTVGATKPSAASLDLLQRLIRPFVLRRTKSEVAKDLPERIEQTLYVELDADERKEYDELARHYRASIGKKLAELGPDRATPHVLEALLRLRQASCHPGLIAPARRDEPSAKVAALLQHVQSVRAEGHKVLVFSQFTALLGIVRRELDALELPYEYLDGKTRDRAAVVNRFQTDAKVGVFLISLKAGGVGLNLTAAEYVYILDPWWNPAAEAQAIDRAHRIGQTRSVIAYRLLTRGTIEERVAELQDKKRDLVRALMGDSGAHAERLTRTDLEALLDLTGE